MVGIPKTIDNDIQILDKTFGFDTAVEEAQRAINAAYVEVTEIGRQSDIRVFILLSIKLLTKINNYESRNRFSYFLSEPSVHCGLLN